MRNYIRMINEMLGQIYQDKHLQKWLDEVIPIQKDRITILHYVIMNSDHLSKEEIEERAYCFGETIQGEEELLARYIFLCLLHLAKMRA